MHTYLHLFIFLYWTIWCFSICLSPSLFLALVCFMAPKRKSTPSWNSLCFRASSSTSSSDSTPSHVWFCDDKARKDFSENFSRRRINLECQVVLSNFSNTDLPTVIHIVGFGSHCVVSRSLVPLWLYKIFTPICTDSIIQYLILSLVFEVRAL